MKILNVFPAYEPAWAWGGVVRCTSTLCRSLAKSGAEISVYTTNADGRGGTLAFPVGVPVDAGGVRVSYFSPTFGPHSVFDSRSMMQALRATVAHFDLIYIAAIWQWIGIEASRIARQRAIPYIIGPHGAFHPATLAQGRLKKLLYWHLFLKQSVQGACALHYTTHYERRLSQVFLPPKESFVVPNALPAEQSAGHEARTTNIRSKFDIPEKSLLLLTVVRPDPVKRLDILLHAFKHVLAQIPEAYLLIVGPCENAYGVRMKKRARELGIQSRTCWAGYTSGSELADCYAQSDLFVLSSEHENFSMVALEAMSAGLPVILSKHVGIAEDAQRWGAGIITETDAGDVARAVVDIARDRQKKNTMADNARKASRMLYSADRVAGLMRAAYHDVLGTSRSPECLWQ